MDDQDESPASLVADAPGPSVRWERVRLNLPRHEAEGALVFWNDALTAVLCKVLSDPIGRSEIWCVELGFGRCAPPPSGLFFSSVDEALHWVARSCASHAAAAAPRAPERPV